MIFLVFVLINSIFLNLSHDGRAYDGPYLKGFPLPYIVESGGFVMCDEIAEDGSCIKKYNSNSNFFMISLLLNILIYLLISVVIVMISSKLHSYFKK